MQGEVAQLGVCAGLPKVGPEVLKLGRGLLSKPVYCRLTAHVGFSKGGGRCKGARLKSDVMELLDTSSGKLVDPYVNELLSWDPMCHQARV